MREDEVQACTDDIKRLRGDCNALQVGVRCSPSPGARPAPVPCCVCISPACLHDRSEVTRHSAGAGTWSCHHRQLRYTVWLLVARAFGRHAPTQAHLQTSSGASRHAWTALVALKWLLFSELADRNM